MAPDRSGLDQLAAQVIDPELDLPLGELGMVRGVQTKRRHATVELAVPLADWPSLDELVARVRAVLAVAPGVEEISVNVSVMTDDERLALRHRLRAEMAGDEHAAPSAQGADDGHGHSHEDAAVPRFLQASSSTRVVGISSGKGGVGKSSVTVNLALALQRSGHRVAILDADVYGFSIPRMLGCEEDPVIIGDTVVPTRGHGVRCLSMGFFVPENEPVIWRGPMLHKAIEQFLGDAYWGEPDFLLVDMPPGTGDVTLSLAQVMPRAEIVVVTTPQAAAQTVAQRSAFAARKLKLSVRGVIENMSWFTGDDGRRYELFGSGGGETLAHDLGVPLLGRVPLVPALREGGDSGQPIMVTDVDGEAAQTFIALSERLVALGPARVYRRELTLR
jgi:ATP-binding protein involved in chromosome partitioning